jgi:phage replication-related protein YjqB (UPF0714/DUF867 family)
VTEEAVLGSRFGFMAFHGGSLEVGTDTIAETAANQAGASLYTVRLPPDLQWHVPSKLVSPDHSPRLAEFLGHVEVAVAVHGYGRPDRFTTLLLGGANRDLAARMGRLIRHRMPDYDVIDEIDAVPTELRGLHPDNPVNRPPAGGVQLELPPRARGNGPFWADLPDGHVAPHTSALIEALIETAREWEEVKDRGG